MKYLIIILDILMIFGISETALSKTNESIGNQPAFSKVAASGNEQKLPYVYTEWKHFTVKDGLPNDHVFAIKPDGAKVWIGTEDGLVCIDKRTGKIKGKRETI